MDRLFIKELVVIVLVFFANKVPAAAAANATFPALFAFGDSILDTGNNNNLGTISKCNFPPYGIDFFGGTPTGRFSDGKVPSDLIAEALGIRATLPAYLDRNLQVQDLATGVCFASGGSGSDIVTSSLLRVISLSAQLQMFRDYIGRLTASVGQEQASNIISNGLYLLSTGNNDIAITYSLSGTRVMPFPVYANLLVGWTSSFLKDLHALGARHVWVLSTLPLGCLPAARAAVGGVLCNELLNGLANQYNGMLQQQINSMRTTTPGFDVQFVDVYSPLLRLILNPFGSGFVNVANGCCGGFAFTFGHLCTLLTGICPNPATHVFWDAAHPTQRAYQLIVSNIMQGSSINSSLAFSPFN